MDNKILGKNISILYRHEHMFVDVELKEYNLNKVQAETLMFLNHQDGVNLTKINDHFLFNKATITKTIKHLEESQYIQRVMNTKDKREKDVFLTEKGRQIVPELIEVFNKWKSRVTRNISENDIAKIGNVLSEMVENITEERAYIVESKFIEI